MRYISRDQTGKALTPREAATYLNGGLWIGLNFEDSSTRATQGSAAGTADALFANTYATQLGAPLSTWLWYSNDTADTYDQVRPYYEALWRVGGRKRGYYGGMEIGHRLLQDGFVDGVWAANAASWSGFGGSWVNEADAARASGWVNMLQHLDHPLIGLIPDAYDLNEVLRPIGAWGAPVTSALESDVGYSQWNDLEKIAMWRDVRNVVLGALRGLPFMPGDPDDASDCNVAGLVLDNLGNPNAPKPTKLNDIHRATAEEDSTLKRIHDAIGITP